MSHSDRLYIRCSYCKKFVLLCRTNANTRQFSDWSAVEAFLKVHLKCNPYHAGENLLGIAGFEIFAWSECTYNHGKFPITRSYKLR